MVTFDICTFVFYPNRVAYTVQGMTNSGSHIYTEPVLQELNPTSSHQGSLQFIWQAGVRFTDHVVLIAVPMLFLFWSNKNSDHVGDTFLKMTR